MDFFEKIEKVVDWLIPVTLVALIFILVIEFLFIPFYEKNILVFEILDGFIIFVFVLDVIFKYKHATSIPNFLKTSWLDIIAVFPFFLMFRVFESFGIITEFFTAGESGQKILHASFEVEKGVKTVSALERETKLVSEVEKEIAAASVLEKEAKVAKEAEVVVKEASRSEKFAKFIKPVFNSPKVLKATDFYQHPKDRKKKQTKTSTSKNKKKGRPNKKQIRKSKKKK